MKELKLRQWGNGFEARVTNKRITVSDFNLSTTDIIVQFTHCNNEKEFKVFNYRKEREVLHHNGLRLSRETAEMLYLALALHLAETQENESPKN